MNGSGLTFTHILLVAILVMLWRVLSSLHRIAFQLRVQNAIPSARGHTWSAIELYWMSERLFTARKLYDKRGLPDYYKFEKAKHGRDRAATRQALHQMIWRKEHPEFLANRYAEMLQE